LAVGAIATETEESPETPAADLSGVSKQFRVGRGSVLALSGIDLTVDEGELLPVVGPSGCGKSTLLRLVAGLDQPTSGQIEAAQALDSGRSSFVFQDPNLLPWRTAVQNVTLPLEMAGSPRRDRVSRAEQTLRRVRLCEEDFGKRPAMLSGGMRMRVSLARALVTQPRMIFFDEPFASLDDLLRQELIEELRKLWRAEGWTALFVTHNVAEAVFLASRRVLVMANNPGRIVREIKIDLPQERDGRIKDDERTGHLVREVRDALREENR
jgi:NitT/TauT family transport system ATP-binding protein